MDWRDWLSMVLFLVLVAWQAYRIGRAAGLKEATEDLRKVMDQFREGS